MSAPSPGPRSKWSLRAAALGAGAIPALAFPEANWWWLAYAGLVPLLLLIAEAWHPREGAVRGWLGGTGFLIATHHWLVFKLGPFLPVAALLVAALWLPWGWGAQKLLSSRSPRAGLGTAVVLASGWVLIEFMRSWEYLGGPFGLLGSTQWNVRSLLSPAALGGVWAVGFLIVWVNVCITLALRTSGLGGRVIAVAAAAVALLVGPVYDAIRSDPEGAGRVTVATVQVGVIGDPDTRVEAGLKATEAVAARGADIVLWGESSVGSDFERSPDLLRRVRGVASEVGADILVNVDALRTRDGGIYKSAVLVTPAGVAGTYDKIRLVPFGEFIPMRAALGWIAEITEAADVDRRRGGELRLLRSDDITLGPLICFESAFPDMSRRLVDMGADLIVFQSATTTFQETWAPEQHASLAAVRAMETGRPTVHATLTGVTAAFDARARGLVRMDTDTVGTRVFDLPLVRGTTAYVRFGDWVPLAAGVIVLIAVVIASRSRAA
ncbi:MAG: apolipoprotein N-acyltransferase [Actinomycetota bacterium]